jgi:hypothetical protein
MCYERFFLSSATMALMFSIFRLGLFYNEVYILLDTVIQIHMKTNKLHLSGREAARH